MQDLFCPECRSTDVKQNSEKTVTCTCEHEFIQVNCNKCKKFNFLSSINEELYACANECGNMFSRQTCRDCKESLIIQLEQLGQQVQCQCGTISRYTGCSQCGVVMPIQNDDLSRNPEYKSQSCKCKSLYNMTDCPFCKQILCFSSAKQSLLKEGFNAVCGGCDQEFGLLKCLQCTQYLKIPNFTNDGKQFICPSCNTDNKNRVYCTQCSSVSSYFDVQIRRYKGTSTECFNTRCKQKIKLTSNQVTRKLQGGVTKPIQGLTKIVDPPVKKKGLPLNRDSDLYQFDSDDNQQVAVDLLGLDNVRSVPFTQDAIAFQLLVQGSQDQRTSEVEYLDDPFLQTAASCQGCWVNINKSFQQSFENVNHLVIFSPCGCQIRCESCCDNQICPQCNTPIKSTIKDLFKRNLVREINEFIVGDSQERQRHLEGRVE